MKAAVIYPDDNTPRYIDLPDPIRAGQPLNVARSYLAVGNAIRGKPSVVPTFENALMLHRTLDRIKAAAAKFGD